MTNAQENQIKLTSVVTPAPGASTATLQAALDACAASGQRFVGAAGAYTLTATLTINCPADMSAMEMTVASGTVGAGQVAQQHANGLVLGAGNTHEPPLPALHGGAVDVELALDRELPDRFEQVVEVALGDAVNL